MNRLGSFVCGMVVGAALLWGAMHYHVVRADDGVYLVPKLSNSLSSPYVDIRQFTLSDWQQHRTLAAALVQSNKSHLLSDSSLSQFRSSIGNLLEGLFDAAPRP